MKVVMNLYHESGRDPMSRKWSWIDIAKVVVSSYHESNRESVIVCIVVTMEYVVWNLITYML